MAGPTGSEGPILLAQAEGGNVAAGDGGSTTAPAATGAAADGPPSVAPDCAVTSQGSEITIPVLANDGDPNGDPLNILSVSQPESGTVEINPDGSLTFAADEPGLAMVRYRVGDGAGGDAAGDVAVLVNPANPSSGGRSVLAGLDEPALAEIASACTAPVAQDSVTLSGASAVVEQVEPGQHVRINGAPGQQIELADPAFADASYFVVDGGLLAISNDGRVVFLADFVAASQAAEPLTLTVAGGPPIDSDVLLESLQPMVVPAQGIGQPASDAGLAHGGGAGFAPYDPGLLPPGFDPLGPLPPTSIGFGEPPVVEADAAQDDLAALDDDGGPPDDGPGDDGGGPPDDGPPDDGPGDDGGGPPDDGGPVADAAIVFQNEVGEFVSALGVYQIGPNGEIVEPRILFPEIEHVEARPELDNTRPGDGPLGPGDQVVLSDLYPGQLEAGTEFGLFLIGDGFRLNDEGGLSGEFAFVDGSGAPATIFTAEPQLLRVTDDGTQGVLGTVFHTADPTPDTPLENPLNPGGAAQSLAAVVSDEELVVVFDDQVRGTGDSDFNDLVLTIEAVDPDGTSLVFNDLTPGLTELLETIRSDPVAVENIPQIDGPVAVAAAPPILPTVTVEVDPGVVA